MDTTDNINLKEASVVLKKLNTSDIPQGITCESLSSQQTNQFLGLNYSNNGTRSSSRHVDQTIIPGETMNRSKLSRELDIAGRSDGTQANTDKKRRKKLHKGFPISGFMASECITLNDQPLDLTVRKRKENGESESSSAQSSSSGSSSFINRRKARAASPKKSYRIEAKIPKTDMELREGGARLIVGSMSKPKLQMAGKIDKIAERLLQNRQKTFFKTAKHYHPNGHASEPNVNLKSKQSSYQEVLEQDGESDVILKVACPEKQLSHRHTKIKESEQTQNRSIHSAKEKILPNILSKSRDRRLKTAPQKRKQRNKTPRPSTSKSRTSTNEDTGSFHQKHKDDSNDKEIPVETTNKWARPRQISPLKQVDTEMDLEYTSATIPITHIHSFPYLSKYTVLRSPLTSPRPDCITPRDDVHVNFEPVESSYPQRHPVYQTTVKENEILDLSITKPTRSLPTGIEEAGNQRSTIELSSKATSMPVLSVNGEISFDSKMPTKDTSKKNLASPSSSTKSMHTIPYADYYTHDTIATGVNPDSPAAKSSTSVTMELSYSNINEKQEGDNLRTEDKVKIDTAVPSEDHKYTRTPEATPTKREDMTKSGNKTVLSAISKQSGQIAYIKGNNAMAKKKTQFYAVKCNDKIIFMPTNDCTYSKLLPQAVKANTKDGVSLLKKLEKAKTTSTITKLSTEEREALLKKVDKVFKSTLPKKHSTSNNETSKSTDAKQTNTIPGRIETKIQLEKINTKSKKCLGKKKRKHKKRLSKPRSCFVSHLGLVIKEEPGVDEEKQLSKRTPSERGRIRHAAGSVYKTPIVKHADVVRIKLTEGIFKTVREKVVITLTNGSVEELKALHKYGDIRARFIYEDIQGNALKYIEVDDLQTGFYHIHEFEDVSDLKANTRVSGVLLRCLPATREIIEEGETYIAVGTLVNLFSAQPCKPTTIPGDTFTDVMEIDSLLQEVLPPNQHFNGQLNISDSSYRPQVDASAWYKYDRFEYFTKRYCKVRKFEERVRYERKTFGKC